MGRRYVRHWSMAEKTPRPTVPVPAPAEVAASLPSEAVKFDPQHPPVSGSVQRDPIQDPAGQPR
jgi:hypothetical protein